MMHRLTCLPDFSEYVYKPEFLDTGPHVKNASANKRFSFIAIHFFPGLIEIFENKIPAIIFDIIDGNAATHIVK